MARDRDGASASSAGADGQSKRASIENQHQQQQQHHGESDSQSDTSTIVPPQQHPQQHHPHRHHHPKQAHQKHHVSRGHVRVNSSKALHKQHGPPGSKLTRRITSPYPESSDAADAEAAGAPPPPRLSGSHSHRRATSDVKLPRNSSATHLPKSLSHTSLKRNRSHVEIGKRTRSSEKLKRTASGTGINRGKLPQKGQVHFDLGDDDQVDDEWVDASGSNSPYLSRKGSINSSTQSSLHPNSRPQTPKEAPDDSADPPQPEISSPERERLNHRQYLTSRLLRRTPSHGAPPQMTNDMATVAPPQLSPGSTDRDSVVVPHSGGNDDLTSRFVATPGSGATNEGSFYQHTPGTSRRSEDLPSRPHSMANLSQPISSFDGPALIEPDNSALVPRPGRRSAAPPAESSRIQQKLNLQRASSVIEPSQAVNGASGVAGASAVLGVGGPGHDGGNARDPRIGKLLERTGMEYLVVRRYQNPIARSLNRVRQLPGADKSRRIVRTNTGSPGGKRVGELPVRHARNVSMPEPRRPVTPRVNGTVASFEGEEDGHRERVSGTDITGSEGDVTAALLRNLWDKSMDLSASTD